MGLQTFWYLITSFLETFGNRRTRDDRRAVMSADSLSLSEDPDIQLLLEV
jgi:hypothetical protein